MNANFHFHPSQRPRLYLLRPYHYCRNSKATGDEVCYSDESCPVKPFMVNSFSEIRDKICSVLNLPTTSKVTIDPVGEEDFDEGITFGNSLAIYVSSDAYDFCVSVDCYTSFNANQWLENNKYLCD